MSLNNGMVGIGPLQPVDTRDTYPMTDQQYNLGGYRSVANAAARLAIPTPRRAQNMLVVENDTGKWYQLGADFVTWSDVTPIALSVLAGTGGAALIGMTTAGNITGPTVQGVINQLGNSTGAGVVGFTPVANLSSTNIQAAIAEEITDLAASSGASLLGFIQGWSGAVARTAQSKMRDTNSPADAGAVGNGSTDDTTAMQAVSATGLVELGPFTYKTGILAPPSGSWFVGRGVNSVIASTSAAEAITVNANSTYRDFAINSTTALYGLSANANATDVVIDNVQVLGLNPSSAGHAFVCNSSGTGNWRLSNCYANVRNYGMLWNTTAGGFSGLTVTGCNFISQNTDAIAINSPTAGAGGRITDVAITGCILKTLNTGTGGSNSGFGISLAHVGRVSIGATTITESRIAAIHIEDASQYVSVTGVVAYNCYGHGITMQKGSVSGDTDGTPAVISGCQFYSANKAATKAGVYTIFDGSGTYSTVSMSAITCVNFDSGFWLGGGNFAVYDIASCLAKNCNYALTCDGEKATVKGRLMVDTCNYLVQLSTANTRLTRMPFFECLNKPVTGLIYRPNAITGDACVIEGFSWPDNFSHSGGSVNQYFTLFAVGTTFFGNLTVRLNGSTAADFIDYEVQVKWDGTTLTPTVLRSTVSGAFSAPTQQVSGGNLQFGFTSSATENTNVLVHFTGEYYA